MPSVTVDRSYPPWTRENESDAVARTPTSSFGSLNASTDQKSQHIHITNDKATLSLPTLLKIQELKRLMYKFPQYYPNPDAFVRCATFYSINGDST
jgi:hypothetical protein